MRSIIMSRVMNFKPRGGASPIEPVQAGLMLLFLPLSSPNRNLIERLGKFLPGRALDGQCHRTFAEMELAINAIRDGLSTPHAERLETLMTPNFQRCGDGSLMAA
jgi:hypothetical protein